MRGLLARFRTGQDGVSAVEFAMVAPIFLLLLSAAVDFGSVVYARMQMENAAQSAMTYAMGHGQPLDSASAASLAQDVQQIIVAQLGSTLTLTVDINHGAQRSYVNGTSQASGTASHATQCYCPSITGAGVAWGTAMACNKPCTGGDGNGKFVYLRISQPFSPIFGSYGLVEDGLLRLQTLGRIQ
jgi:Flp pilus assembly protein TadG